MVNEQQTDIVSYPDEQQTPIFPGDHYDILAPGQMQTSPLGQVAILGPVRLTDNRQTSCT